MRIRDPMNEPEEPFNLVPLTDMVFNLLIFFMAATTFAQVEKEMGLALPKTSSTFQTLSATPSQLIINIDAEGTPKVAGKAYDLKGLSDVVAASVKRNPTGVVTIRADERGYVKGFAAVARTVKQAGVTEAKIAYVPDGSTP